MGILSSLGLWPGARPPLDENVRRAIDGAIEAVDPLLKTVSGHERQLGPVVTQALAYCEKLAAEVPGPVDIGARAFGADPMVHAMFATSRDIADMLARSRDLRLFLDDPARDDGDELFALLGMRHGEKRVIGAALNGDAVQTGVLQRLLYFADHTLGEPDRDCATTRRRFQESAFNGLVLGFADTVAELRRQRQEANAAWRMEHAAPNSGAERRQDLEEQQRRITDALAPKNLLGALVGWLAAPQEHLYLKPTEVTVDRMGVMADRAIDESFHTFNFPELVCRDRRHWIVVVARISRQEAVEAVNRQQEGNRYLML